MDTCISRNNVIHYHNPGTDKVADEADDEGGCGGGSGCGGEEDGREERPALRGGKDGWIEVTRDKYFNRSGEERQLCDGICGIPSSSAEVFLL